MASSNASVHTPSHNPVRENIVPLESVVTDRPSGSYVRAASGSVDPQEFTRHASANAFPQDPSPERETAWSSTLESQRTVLRRLKAWHQWDTDRYKSLGKFLISKAGFLKRPICPSDLQLVSLATYLFPPRLSLKVTVCDFGEGRFERFDADYANLEQCKSLLCSQRDGLTFEYCTRLEEETDVGSCTVDVCDPNPKAPDMTDVRRHIPVGSGLFESSLENLFSHRKIKKGPYHRFEVLNFRGRQYLQDQLDVFNILRESPRLETKLDRLTSKDYDANRSLQGKLQVRASASYGFWNSVQSDLPWQLDEGIRSSYFKIEIAKGSLAPRIGQQMLSRHPVYSNAVLVRDYFRCFPHNDGFLLTTSPTVGINYLDTAFERDIEIPPNIRSAHQSYSALEKIRRRWECNGTASWPSKSVHWLMVLLIIELEVTPHSTDLGKTDPDIQNAYLPIVRDLKRRRASRFRRHESVNLVREYVSCMDEISQIHEMSMQKIEFLGKLRDHYDVLGDDTPCGFQGYEKDLLTERINAAVRQIKKDNENLPRLIKDLKASLDVLFQLRSIEQNELAILAESNNKAILVFTVVTIIFLPLSFFTSYFGMNLQGIANTDKTQGYFWAVCGSVTLLVVIFTVVFGFKERFYGWIWANRDYARPREMRQ